MAQANRYALIIGNTEYRNDEKKLCPLATPSVDVRAMARVLGDPDIGDFKVKKLLNKEWSSLNKEIQTFLNARGPDDTALLYFSGHGVVNDDGELHLATPNTQEKVLESTSTPLSFILKMLERSYAERKILILDCCYSGTATQSMGPKSQTLWKPSLEKPGKGTAILAASTARQMAFETLKSEKVKENAPSVFTRFLVEGLETGNAAQEGKPYISATDLFKYAEDRMREVGAKHTPELKLTSAQGSIRIARNAKYVKLPELLQRLVDSPLSTDQQRAIRRLDKLAAGEDQDLAKRAREELKRLSLSEYAEIRRKARTVLTKLRIQPPQLPIKLRILFLFKALSHGAIDAFNKKPWWFVTFIAILPSLGILSLKLPPTIAFIIGVFVAILAFGSWTYFVVSVAKWLSMGYKKSAQLESSVLLALFGAICCAGFITFQTDCINRTMRSIFALRIERPLLEEPVAAAPARPSDDSTSQPGPSWSETIEDWFTFEDRDDAIRIFFVAFAVLGGLTGLSTAKESHIAGMLLGATGGGIIGTLMGAIVSAAMSFGDNLQNILP